MNEKEDTRKLTIDMKLLERIAEYYEFPIAVFFGTIQQFPKNKDIKRTDIIVWKAKQYDLIKDIVECGEDGS